MTRHENDLIVILVSRLVSPFIMLFALYVIFHGHYSPGGGFQGGAMLAASLLLIRLAAGSEVAEFQFRKAWATPLGALGVLIYFVTGFAAIILGGNFLDYSQLIIPGLSGAALRSMGILIVEVGVGLAVMAILVGIFDDLLGEDEDV